MSTKAQLQAFNTWQGAHQHYCDKRDFTRDDVPDVLPDDGIMFTAKYSPYIFGPLKGKKTLVQYTPQADGRFVFMEEIDE